jgi:hypothetical protein
MRAALYHPRNAGVRERAEPMIDRSHRLGAMLADAAKGRFPAADFEVEVVGSPPGRSDVVVAFSAHSVVAAPLDPSEVLGRLEAGDPGAPVSAPFLAWLGERLRTTPGMLDLVVVADRLDDGEVPLQLRRDTSDEAHARVDRARLYRTDVEVHTDAEERGIVILGRGLAGRLEVGVEVGEAHRGRGLGAALARAARTLVGDDEPLFAQVTPGNVASVRAFLAAGYRPICSEVLFLRA